MVKVKNTLLIILTILLMLVLSGCYPNKSSVKLATQDEITRYAKARYGKATVIDYVEHTGTEKIEGADTEYIDSIDYTLEDKEYKFRYTITSRVYDVWIDASVGYTETKNSDFDKEYTRFIFNKLGDELNNTLNKYSATISLEKNQERLDIGNTENIEEAIKEIVKSIEKCDSRKYYRGRELKVYMNGEEQGTYYMHKEYKTLFEITVEKKTDQLCNLGNFKKGGLKFKEVKEVFIDDLGIDTDKIRTFDGEIQEKAKVYYFTYSDGTIHFITDILAVDNTNTVVAYNSETFGQ